MNGQFTQWQEKIDSMSLRERVLMLLMATGILLAVIQLVFLDPLLKERTLIKRQLTQISEDIQKQKNEKVLLEALLSVGVNRESINRRDKLQAELKTLDQRIESSVIAMIPPKLMPQVLEDILSQSDDLQLLSLEDRPAVSLIEQTQGESGPSENKKTANSKNIDDTKQALYKHSFVLRLQGTYPATISYFNKLATLPWRFYWDDLLYQVTEYPRAIITLEVHTVSMSEEWIGV